ncbi:MAG TPA: sugar transferase [Candidatus Limnocylindrales bacterium]|jgi:exopolysaccharide biosynthesis polyprenyl glycosylphosphotransferase
MAFRLSLMVADGMSAAGLFVMLSLTRFGADNWTSSWRKAGIDPVWVLAAYALAWVVALWLNGLYRNRVRWSARSEAIDVLRTGIGLAILTFSALFILKMPDVSRLFLLVLFPAQIAVTIAIRFALRIAFRVARSNGFSRRFVLIVGTDGNAEAFARRIERHRELGLRVIGHLHWTKSKRAPTVTRPILGRVDDIVQVLHASVVDEVAICLPPAAWGMIEPIARLCEEEGKIVRVPLFDGMLSLPGAHQEEFDGIPILSLVYGPDRIIALVGKRVLDILGSATALVLLSPVLLAVALWILRRDGRPVLFRQPRVGLHGRAFEVVKFRSMVPDAEARLPDLLEQNEIQGHAFKMQDDPRLSSTGGWLRRTSIDELPQLWNVLKGEMSLVGPRPPLPREVSGYDVWHRRRLSMKPGITGLWQVSARNEEEFDRWVEMDLDYIDRWSLWLDLKIMLRTIPAMLQGR